MSLLTWDNYFRKYVNRRESSLISPKVIPVDEFELSKASVLHYLPVSGVDKGPSYNDPVFRGVQRLVYSWYVDGLVKTEGSPKIVSAVYQSDIRRYHLDNKRIKRVFDISSAMRDVESPLVVNYCYIERKYKYLPSPRREWNMLVNKLATVVSSMDTVYRASQVSHQYLMVELPKMLPGYQDFIKINKLENLTYIEKFNDIGSYLILNIFNMLREKEERRDEFSVLSQRCLDKINIVFIDSGYFTILNLGLLKSWCKSSDNPKGKNPIIMQRYLLRMLLTMMRVRDGEGEELVEAGRETDEDDSYADIATAIREEQDADTDTSMPEIELPEVDESDDSDEIKDTSPDSSRDDIADDKSSSDDEDRSFSNSNDKSFTRDEETDDIIYHDTIMTPDEERELKLLEDSLKESSAIIDKVKSKKDKVRSTGVDYRDIEDAELSPSESNMLILDNLIDQHLLTPSEYAKNQVLAEKYKSIRIADTTMEEYIDIPREATQVEEKVVPDIETVADKDMLKSTLIDFDAHYVDEVMDRDTASMVVNLQKAGIMITDYRTKERESSAGRFVDYEVDITPIKGRRTSWKFTLPKIEKDGTYMSNGSWYRLRRQKTDVPIRKVASDKVALTSAYGKVFVKRSEQARYNYRKWLADYIRAASLDQSNSRVTETRTANVFDSSIRTPYLYSTLAKEFRTFTANGIFFYLDYHKRQSRFKLDDASLSSIESKDEYTLCGVDKNKHFVVVDYRNKLYSFVDGKYIPLPAIEDIVGLDRTKAKLEMIDIQVMGLDIPLALILAYQLGWSELLRLLDITYEVSEDTRIRPTSDQIAIQFRDKKYFFSRDDDKATFILNGFNAYKNEIKLFDAFHFDNKAIYFNLIDTKHPGRSSRTLKEVDLLFNLFIDPITLRILQDLKLPTTFRGLLFKAAEMLLTDDHPDEVDASQQRIRSYERIPALVYTELAKTVRKYYYAANRGNVNLSINPTHVLMTFLNDPANVAVKSLSPFQEMRLQEAATYTGIGGRSKETMVKRTRKFDKNDIGVISEASTDSGDAGVSIYTTANPQFTNVYGISKTTQDNINPDTYSTVSKMSSVFNLMPCIEKDDELLV